ncbi:helix-turn-helix domain-containing protein [Streptomyces sp. DSM 41972]|uniref:Helix-turn-helix domain-containing protein n=1 Tax=Streptomyces althioticus subsp. attaecolombicae TaxID=3075534 RepID=A0ABU3I5U6_9ACTN|nr:helix-turn-helix domain-containing protein [Streptomyces sp. DSM 41972]
MAEPHGRLRTIAATGRRWGFADASHFSKMFKRTYGMSPRSGATRTMFGEVRGIDA